MTKPSLVEKPLTFAIIEGGKQDDVPITIEPKLAGAGPKGPDWLRDLGFGARFCCHPLHSAGVWLEMYGIAFVLDECILLLKNPGTLGGELGWVDSRKFSSQYKLVAVLPEQPDKEAGKDNEHHLSRSADSKDNDGHEGSA